MFEYDLNLKLNCLLAISILMLMFEIYYTSEGLKSVCFVDLFICPIFISKSLQNIVFTLVIIDTNICVSFHKAIKLNVLYCYAMIIFKLIPKFDKSFVVDE